MGVTQIVWTAQAVISIILFIWGIAKGLAKLEDIHDQLTSLPKVREAAELATRASNDALDEWRGATEAVRQLTDGHTHRLDDHDRRLSALEEWQRGVGA